MIRSSLKIYNAKYKLFIFKEDRFPDNYMHDLVISYANRNNIDSVKFSYHDTIIKAEQEIISTLCWRLLLRYVLVKAKEALKVKIKPLLKRY